MQHAMPIILLVITALFVAVPIAKAIWSPIKRRRETRKWQQWKKQYARAA